MKHYYKAIGCYSTQKANKHQRIEYPLIIENNEIELITYLNKEKDWIEVVFEGDGIYTIEELNDLNKFWLYEKPSEKDIKLYERYEKAWKLLKK